MPHWTLKIQIDHPPVVSITVTGSEGSTIVATVLGGVFAAIVGVVAVTVVAVFVCRRKKRKQVVLHHTAMSNPVYEGNEFQQTWHKFAQLSIIFFLLFNYRWYFRCKGKGQSGLTVNMGPFRV